jgi:superfamily II DNA or RNA helicase
LRRFKPEEFGLVIIDEAHHAIARSYRKILDYFRDNAAIKVLGVTATPKRSDDLALGKVFDTVAYEYGIEAAVHDGWLVPVRQRIVVVDKLDFSSLRTVAGDFDQGQLERIVSEESVLHEMAAPTVELAGNGPVLVFTVGVKQAQELAAIFNRYKPNSAAWVSGETPTDERRETVKRYQDGNLQFLCNCGVFLEGFDAPRTALVVMARPTKSLGLYTQMIGRGTRPLPNAVDGKEDAIDRRQAIEASSKPMLTVLDFVGNAYQHGSQVAVSAADILGGKYGEPIRAYAKRTMQAEGQSATIDAALERAEAEMLLLEEETERRRNVQAKAQYRLKEVFGGDVGAKREYEHQSNREPATQKQIGMLHYLGMPWQSACKLTKKQASAIINKKLNEREGAA